MKRSILLLFHIVFVYALTASCSSEYATRYESPLNNTELLKMYDRYYNQTAESYMAIKHQIKSKNSRAQDLNLIAYLLTLPKSTIDSLMLAHRPTESDQNRIDSLLVTDISNFCEIYGNEAYQNYVDFLKMFTSQET